MRLLKMVLLVSVLVALFGSPGLFTEARNAVARAFTPTASAAPADQSFYDRLCPLVDTWTSLDEQGRTRAAAAVARVATKQARRTEDPTAEALATLVPMALNDGASARNRAARAILAKECDAHHK